LTGIEICNIRTFNDRSKVIIGLSLVFWIGLTQVPEAMVSLARFLLASVVRRIAIVYALYRRISIEYYYPGKERLLEN